MHTFRLYVLLSFLHFLCPHIILDTILKQESPRFFKDLVWLTTMKNGILLIVYYIDIVLFCVNAREYW